MTLLILSIKCTSAAVGGIRCVQNLYKNNNQIIIAVAETIYKIIIVYGLKKYRHTNN